MNKSYLKEVWDDAITNQDIDTNFSALLTEQLEHEIKEGDINALCGELADFIIEKGGL